MSIEAAKYKHDHEWFVEESRKFQERHNRECDEMIEMLKGRIAERNQKVSISSLWEPLLSIYDDGFCRGDSTGWENVDQLYTVRRGEMTIVTGIPGSGKTTWLDAVIINLTVSKGWRVAMYSAENLPLERHVSTLCEQLTGDPFRKGPIKRIEEGTLMSATEHLDAHIKFIMPTENNDTVPGILGLALELHEEKKLDGLVIDPWNEIEHVRPQWCTETEHISMMLKKIRGFARENNIHIWVVAHPTKLKKNDRGEYPLPTPYDIAGGAHWRNKADNCITIWREFGDRSGKIEIHVQKIRFREVGRLGNADLYFNPVNCRYYESEIDMRMAHND